MEKPPVARVITGTEPGGIASATNGRFTWDAGELALDLLVERGAPRLAGISGAGVDLLFDGGLALVDLVTADSGHTPSSDRLTHSTASTELLLDACVEDETSNGMRRLTVRLVAAGGLAVCVRMTAPRDVAALHVETEVANDGDERDYVLRSVTSFSARLGHRSGAAAGVQGWRLDHALSDWLGENRWRTSELRGGRLVPLREDLTGHDPRGALRAVSTGTWSTGRFMPVAALSSVEHGAAWAWQIEHNGPWRWEVGEDTVDGWFALSGPNDDDHQWTTVLAPGERFEAVPVTVALGVDADSALGQLTRYRRVSRRPHPDNATMPVVFNDYMNTLNGDPTTEKLLPLIDAAAAVGVEVFCVDAGWYADGYWWDSVGEWLPSVRRFPGGLGEVVERIRSHGLVPGLWLEPEVVGVNSPVAATLPDGAFLQRHGQRLVEHERFHLDLRHPAARAHLDAVVDRLVHEFGIGYFKLDYNIDPGAGTDHDAVSVGAGLLEHNRAHLTWLDGVLDRHPGLVLENCGSGAMRADWAMLSRLQLQSTSDQQDFRLYPPIAASAPAAMLPEQAASWAYPQPEMTEEEVAFCLITGLLGRFFLSGYLNAMDETRLGLVREAVQVAKDLRPVIASSIPVWPLGRPAWDAPVVAVGLESDRQRLVAVWDRTGTDDSIELPFPDLAGAACAVEPVFPTSLTPWPAEWEAGTGTLRVHNPSRTLGARVFRITSSDLDD